MNLFDNLSISDTLRFHKELWTWLSENPECEKRDWPGWAQFRRKPSEENGLTDNGAYWELHNNITSINECFCCALLDNDKYPNKYSYSIGMVNWCGKNCLFDWPGECCCAQYVGDDAIFNSDDGLFTQWEEAEGEPEQRAEIAIQIANLPIKEHWQKLLEEELRDSGN